MYFLPSLDLGFEKEVSISPEREEPVVRLETPKRQCCECNSLLNSGMCIMRCKRVDRVDCEPYGSLSRVARQKKSLPVLVDIAWE